MKPISGDTSCRRALVAGPVWLVVWLAACVHGSPPVPPAAEMAADSAVRITLERGPCFGTCPIYTVTLDGSGAVRFEGRRFVADTGVSTGTVPRARIDSLVAELEAGGYFGFADRYIAGEPACERYATDLPSATTEVRAGGRYKRVVHDHGCMDAPERLTSLEARIDQVAGVARWIRP
jgi:Domain of unknown function (DUF6438)